MTESPSFTTNDQRFLERLGDDLVSGLCDRLVQVTSDVMRDLVRQKNWNRYWENPRD